MVIKIEQIDIDVGIRQHGNDCPVARVFKKLYPRYDIYTMITFTELVENGYVMQIFYHSQEFISNFDRGLPVIPGEYECSLK